MGQWKSEIIYETDSGQAPAFTVRYRFGGAV
jgi:hypothetical protein